MTEPSVPELEDQRDRLPAARIRPASVASGWARIPPTLPVRIQALALIS